MVECSEEALREEVRDAKNTGSADTRYVAPPLTNKTKTNICRDFGSWKQLVPAKETA